LKTTLAKKSFYIFYWTILKWKLVKINHFSMNYFYCLEIT